MTREASVVTGAVTERQCIVEHMLAHGITARVRIERYGAPASSGESD
jgi:sulfopropanediol 3-dehydrogenase